MNRKELQVGHLKSDHDKLTAINGTNETHESGDMPKSWIRGAKLVKLEDVEVKFEDNNKNDTQAQKGHYSKRREQDDKGGGRRGEMKLKIRMAMW